MPHSTKTLTEVVVHKVLHVENIGLYIDSEKPWYGASPDAVINCSCCGHGVLEIKCPYKVRHDSLIEEINNGSFYVGIDNGIFFLVQDHQYYYQVQLEISVTKVSYCDFMVCTPSEFLVIRIEPNFYFVESVTEKCDLFWDSVILKELVTRGLEGYKKLEVPSTSNIDKTVDGLYCICKSKYSDDASAMVGCDSCDNWFHLHCLKLKIIPKSKCMVLQRLQSKETEINLHVPCLFLIS